MTTGATYEAKVRELKDLVREAVAESRGEYPNQMTPFGSPFEAAGFQDVHLQRLLQTLGTTEALYILNDLLDGKEEA